MAEQVVVWPRRNGRGAAAQKAIAEALARGEHVHTASIADGERCHGGDPNCPAPKASNAEPEESP